MPFLTKIRPILFFTLASVTLANASPDRENGVVMQFFHWYTPPGGLWREVDRTAPMLAERGFTALWLPPAYKGAGGDRDVGYGVYDRYDLGEFDQKGAIPTKYGTRREYQLAIAAAHRADLDVYADVVLNHMLGEDGTEDARAVEVYRDDRNVEIPGTERVIAAPTRFDFRGREGRYSKFVWHTAHFTAVDWDASTRTSAIFKFRGPYDGFQEEVGHEHGNYDYLLGADLDMRNPEVRRELIEWGKWYARNFKLDGVRLDAVKHVPFQFIPDWLDAVRANVRSTRNTPLFAVGEYWSGDVRKLIHYIAATRGKLSLFDVPLHDHFTQAGNRDGFYDMRTILDATLSSSDPVRAVTFVDNHDTQPLQSLESPVATWFKPMAYAIALLREEGYPCVFYADYFGATYTDHGRTIRMPRLSDIIDPLLSARRKYAYGSQRNYFDDPDIVGWTRAGNSRHPGGLAILLNDNRSQAGAKRMCVGGAALRAERRFIDIMGTIPKSVTVDERGCGTFPVRPGSVSVWVPAGATLRRDR